MCSLPAFDKYGFLTHFQEYSIFTPQLGPTQELTYLVPHFQCFSRKALAYVYQDFPLAGLASSKSPSDPFSADLAVVTYAVGLGFRVPTLDSGQRSCECQHSDRSL